MGDRVEWFKPDLRTGLVLRFLEPHAGNIRQRVDPTRTGSQWRTELQTEQQREDKEGST